MTAEAAQLLAVGQVPLADGPIRAARDGPAAIGCDGHTPYPILVTGERLLDLGGLPVPEPHGLVGAAGKDRLAVGGEDNAIDSARVTLVDAHFLSLGNVP